MEKSSFLQGVEYNSSKPVVTKILESDFTKEIRIALAKGVEMKEHQTPYPIVVHVLSGCVDFGCRDDHTTLCEGEMVSLVGSIPHNLVAKEDSIVRLSLSMLDDADRVKKVAE